MRVRPSSVAAAGTRCAGCLSAVLALAACDNHLYDHPIEWLPPTITDEGVVFIERGTSTMASWSQGTRLRSWQGLDANASAQDAVPLDSALLVLSDGSGATKPSLSLISAQEVRDPVPLEAPYDRLSAAGQRYAVAYNSPNYRNLDRRSAGDVVLFDSQGSTNHIATPIGDLGNEAEFPVEIAWVPEKRDPTLLVVAFPSHLRIVHFAKHDALQVFDLDLSDATSRAPFGVAAVARAALPSVVDLSVRGSERADIFHVAFEFSVGVPRIARLQTGGVVLDSLVDPRERILIALSRDPTRGPDGRTLSVFWLDGRARELRMPLEGAYDRLLRIPTEDDALVVATGGPPVSAFTVLRVSDLHPAERPEDVLHYLRIDPPALHILPLALSDERSEIWLFQPAGASQFLDAETLSLQALPFRVEVSTDKAPHLGGTATVPVLWALGPDRRRLSLVMCATRQLVGQSTLPAPVEALLPLRAESGVVEAVVLHPGPALHFTALHLKQSQSEHALVATSHRYGMLDAIARRRP